MERRACQNPNPRFDSQRGTREAALVLVESKNVRQEPGAGRRRWFDSESCGLVVWYPPNGTEVSGFQFLYREQLEERALTWRAGAGFSHNAIDSGSASPFKNLSPILVPDGNVPWEWVRQEFEANAAGLEPELGEFVRVHLEARR